MSPDTPRVLAATALRGLMEQIFMAAGCEANAAGVASDVLLEADLRGYSTHGLLRLPTMIRRIQSGMINAAARPRVVTERAGSALVDADRALGPVGALFGARLAAHKARRAPNRAPTGPSARSASTRALPARSVTTRGRAAALIIPDCMRRIVVGRRSNPCVL